MANSWHIVSWVSGVVVGAYIIVQMLAMKRLNGKQQRRSRMVIAVMLIATLVERCVHLVLENREATGIVTAIVGAIAIVATAVLARMLYGQKSEMNSGFSR